MTLETGGFRLLSTAGHSTIREYEEAATSVGRLDSAAALAPGGLQRLLVLRCVSHALGLSRTGMIALIRPDGEGDHESRTYRDALITGASRARGGAVPSLASMHKLLAVEPPDDPQSAALDALLRDAYEKTPPLLKAALASGGLLLLRSPESEGETVDRTSIKLATLAVSLILCVGGATTDAWLTLPLLSEARLADGPREGNEGWDEWLGAAFGLLAREARTAQRALAVVRALVESDIARVRDALGRAAYSALDVLALLSNELVITVPDTARSLDLTPPTAGAAIARLTELGIAQEITGRTRSRAFVYGGLVDAFAPPLA